MGRTFVLFVVMMLAACGGEAQPAKSPDEPSGSEVDGGEEITMANPTGVAPPDPETAPVALQVPILLPKEALKIVLKGKRKPTNLEIKPDGALTNGAKTAATFGREGTIQDANGQPALVVKGDAVSTPSGAAIATFTGDNELTILKTNKLLLDDAGSFTLNDAAVGKVEAVANFKRTALLAVMVTLFPPEKLQEQPKPKPTGKPTPKGRGKKR